VLDEILKTNEIKHLDSRLLVGNDTRDDAAVYRFDDEHVVISTTDFFMPIVDDPFDFGCIASVNAISDIFAMGGEPIMAISILGWPVDTLPVEVARKVVEGARHICKKAGIALAGGHSIDTPEPIFGLAVTGRARIEHVRTNNTATPGCTLYLTKPLGIGILTTAQKKGILREDDFVQARNIMLTLNSIGPEFAQIEAVRAMTDVTGFGLLGHLAEICTSSQVSAEIYYDAVPKIEGLERYLSQKTFPGGTKRNYDSYGHLISSMGEEERSLLCDPQTSGGLLVAVEPGGEALFHEVCNRHGLNLQAIGRIVPERSPVIQVHT
jgi:selenide,water dikinase